MYACWLQGRLQENVHHEPRFAWSWCCSESWYGARLTLYLNEYISAPKYQQQPLLLSGNGVVGTFCNYCHVDPQLISQNDMTEALSTSHFVCCSEAQRITTRENEEYKRVKLTSSIFLILDFCVGWWKHWIFTGLAFYISKNIQSTIGFRAYKISLVLTHFCYVLFPLPFVFINFLSRLLYDKT